jgi:pyruvate dehydrogenase E2 component (dihydrolipoamide acetyltransferase)
MPDVTMPRLSDTMQEGKIARWLKQPGDSVSPGDVLAEIETDKATMELEAYDAGVLERIVVPEGQSAPIGQAIAVIGAGDGAATAHPPNTRGDSPPQPPNPGGSPTHAAPAGTGPAAPSASTPPAAPAAPTNGAATPSAAQPPVASVVTTPAEQSQPAAETAPTPTDSAVQSAPPPTADQSPAEHGAVRASPMARAIARERGIDLRTVHGSGPGGRVIRAYVEAASSNGQAPVAAPSTAPASAPAPAASARPGSAGVPPVPAPPPQTPSRVGSPASATAGSPPELGGLGGAAPPTAGEDVEVRPTGRVHQVMADRTLQSVRDVPQYYLTAEVDMQAALDLRRQLEAAFGEEPRITINAIVLRAVALALREVPEVNSVWRDGQWLIHRRVHLGVAVAIPDGLIVPVIRDADRKSLREIAVESRALAGRAREGKLSLPEVQGSTFSVTNLGMFDVEEFHGIINPPEAGLLAVGTVVEKPVGLDGQIVLRPRMRVTLTADHRAYSGDVGARFLQAAKRLLEQPLRLGF